MSDDGIIVTCAACGARNSTQIIRYNRCPECGARFTDAPPPAPAAPNVPEPDVLDERNERLIAWLESAHPEGVAFAGTVIREELAIQLRRLNALCALLREFERIVGRDSVLVKDARARLRAIREGA